MIQPTQESSDEARKGLAGNFKRFFMRGLAALLPTLVTIAILIWAYELVNSYLGRYLTNGFVSLMAGANVPKQGDLGSYIEPAVRDALAYGEATNEIIDQRSQSPLVTPDLLRRHSGKFVTREFIQIEYWSDRDRTARQLRRLIVDLRAARLRAGPVGSALSLSGFLVAIMFVWVVGVALASFVGRRTWPRIEAFVTQLPLVKAIYPHVKQVTDFILSERGFEEFSGVVAIQYPRKGIWSLGLMTGAGIRRLDEEAGTLTSSVFIPSSPTPFTGYVITVPRQDIVVLPITIDDALRFTVSGGVIKPPGQGRPADVAEAATRMAAAESTGEALAAHAGPRPHKPN